MQGSHEIDTREAFLRATTFAVAGASKQREKYGNIIYRALRDSGRNVYPINPRAAEVEGQVAYPDLLSLPVVPQALSIVTSPEVTRDIVKQAIAIGVSTIWMQPGAEDRQSSQEARQAGIEVIDDGSCILVILSRMR